MSFPAPQTHPKPVFAFRLTETMVIRTGKIAAVLFALYFTYFLKEYFLVYATEPKVIGGVDLDRPIPQLMYWSPVYYPMLLAALFAYWTWPSRLARTLPRSLISGSFAIFRIELCGLLVSLLCPGLGAFYLAYPTLMKSEVLAMSMGILVEAVQTWAFMGMFLAMPIIGCSVVVGCLIGLGVHTASKHLVNSTPGAETEVRNTQVNFASPSTLWRTSKAGPWTSLVAGLIVAAIMLAGFNLMGFWIFTFWIQNFMKVAIPCIALGAAIGSISKHWALCVAASLPIGFYLSNTHYNSPGIFTSQSIDFPPVLFAVLMGFGLARKFAPRIFARLQG